MVNTQDGIFFISVFGLCPALNWLGAADPKAVLDWMPNKP